MKTRLTTYIAPTFGLFCLYTEFAAGAVNHDRRITPAAGAAGLPGPVQKWQEGRDG